jgi:RNA polymerase sigma factor (sigma-70 family)
VDTTTDSSSSATSFDAFVSSALPSAMRLATSLTASPHDGWDLVQDSLVKLFRSWDRVDRDENPSAYLRSIIVRTNLNRLRSMRRELAAMSRLPRVDEHCESDTAEPWLFAALAKLSRQQRTSIVLVHAWSYRVDEVAAMLNCRPNTIRTHLSRGLAALRTAAGHELEATSDAKQH